MDRANWQRLDDGKTWGVKVQGYPTVHATPGDLISVPRRDGTMSTVRLGSRVASWNGRRAQVFAVARDHETPKAVRQTWKPTPPTAIRDTDDLNERWFAHKAEYAERERELEAEAFMSGIGIDW